MQLIENTLRKARFSFKNGDKIKAQDLCNQALIKYPKNLRIHNLLSKINYQDKLKSMNNYFANGNYDIVIKLASELIKFNNKDPHLYNTLGLALYELNNLDDAILSYLKAIKISPSFAVPYLNLGNVYLKKEDYPSAIKNYNLALNIEPKNYVFLKNLFVALFKYTPASYQIDYTNAYEHLLSNKNTLGYENLQVLISRTINYLMLNPIFKNLNLELNSLKNNKDLEKKLHEVSNVLLFHLIISDSIIYDLDFEKLLINLRKIIFMNIEFLANSVSLYELIQSLALNSLFNDYIFYETNTEIEKVTKLEYKILDTIAQSQTLNGIDYIALSMYRNLSNYGWSNKLIFNNCSKQYVDNFINYPLEEKEIIDNIITFKEIENKMSLKVKNQYEVNPYPKWKFCNLNILGRKIKLDEFLELENINFRLSKNKSNSRKSILIAGSGTGKEVIEYALTLDDCDIVTIDLCKTSLSYAIRKSREYNITNVTFLHGDILDLKSLNKQFDFIISSGVLHHMDNPLDGWKILTDILKKDGLMKVGLYSKIARLCIKNIQNEVSQFESHDFNTIIKKYRNSLIESNDLNFHNIKSFGDFYSTSALRDLVGHVNEHQFSLPQIEGIIDNLNLTFCGFLNVNDIYTNFERFFGSKKDISNLKYWDILESNETQIFQGMYQLFLQKNN